MFKKFLTWLLQAVIGLVFVVGGALVLVEWASGCGETYIDAQGRRHSNECIIINRKGK